MLVRVLPVCLVALLGLAASPVPRIQFTDTRLKNGLRLIVSEEHAAPMFSIVVNYNVGSRDERKGRTGFAHLFEHMHVMNSRIDRLPLPDWLAFDLDPSDGFEPAARTALLLRKRLEAHVADADDARERHGVEVGGHLGMVP